MQSGVRDAPVDERDQHESREDGHDAVEPLLQVLEECRVEHLRICGEARDAELHSGIWKKGVCDMREKWVSE